MRLFSVQLVHFVDLVHNESLKLVRRRRPQLVLVILVLFLAIATWAQHRQAENARVESNGGDWRAQAESRIDALERGAQRRHVFAGFARFQRFEAARLRYHLERGIDPDRQTGPLFARGFATLAASLLLPLLITVLAADLVTSEVRGGTIKMLLTRPVARWKVLASKIVAAALFASLLVTLAGVLAWAIGGVAFGWAGWGAPVLTGFRSTVDGADMSGVRIAPLWIDALAAYGLAWLGALSVVSLAVTFSVLFRSSVGAMGTLMAIVVAGPLLGQLATDWRPARWLFPTNLPLTQFYSGSPPPVDGMTVGSAAAVLAVWSVVSLSLAFVVFERRDVTA
jgi:ABC-2 type transport system permease protein